jgi:hypothetical protein
LESLARVLGVRPGDLLTWDTEEAPEGIKIPGLVAA